MSVYAPVESLRGSEFVAYVRTGSGARRLEPLAVLINAAGEGLRGGIGENGAGYGPWQLLPHRRGGPLPVRFDSQPDGSAALQAWAWSAAGVDFALDLLAGAAAGLDGVEQVRAIAVLLQGRMLNLPEVERRVQAYAQARSLGGEVWARLAALAAGGPELAAGQPAPTKLLPAQAAPGLGRVTGCRASDGWRKLLEALAYRLPAGAAAALEARGRLLETVR